MTSRDLFQIPSAEEIDQSRNKPSEVKSLFTSHQQDIRARIKKARETSPQKGPKLDTHSRTPAAQTDSAKTQCQKIPSSHLATTAPNKIPSTKHDERQESLASTSAASFVSGGTNEASKDKSKELQSSRNKELNPQGAQICPSKPTKTNSIIVSPRQRGNPILKHIRNVAWEYGETVADYQLGQTTCALYLSLKYHNLSPNYIHERLKQLGHSYKLRVLLVQVDVKDPHHALQELANMCILADCTLILAFSPEEAGRYLETYKAFESKPPDLIMEKTEGSYLSRFTECLTSVKKVNKTDASTLLSTFGTFKKVTEASEEDLSLCPGLGPQKAQRLHAAFREPYLKSRKKPANSSDPKKVD